MNPLEKYIQRTAPRKFAVVGVLLDEAGYSLFAAVAFVRKENTLQHRIMDSCRSFEAIADTAPHTPIVLQLEGEQIVHRERSNTPGQQQASENLFEQHDPSDGYSVLAKKEACLQVVHDAEDAGLQLLDVSLGCTGFSSLKHVMPTHHLGHYHVGDLPYFEQPTDETVLLDNAPFPIQKLSLWLRGVQWSQKTKTSPFHQNWFWHRAQQGVLKFGLPVILLVLLVNFLFYQPLYTEVQQLQSIAGSTAFQGWHEQKRLHEQRQEMIALNTEQHIGQKSWYADQLLEQMNAGITLTTLQVFPVRGTIKPGKAPVIRSDEIVLSGVTKTNKALESWMDVIDTLPWVNSHTLSEYQAQNNLAAFTLHLEIKP